MLRRRVEGVRRSGMEFIMSFALVRVGHIPIAWSCVGRLHVTVIERRRVCLWSAVAFELEGRSRRRDLRRLLYDGQTRKQSSRNTKGFKLADGRKILCSFGSLVLGLTFGDCNCSGLYAIERELPVTIPSLKEPRTRENWILAVVAYPIFFFSSHHGTDSPCQTLQICPLRRELLCESEGTSVRSHTVV